MSRQIEWEKKVFNLDIVQPLAALLRAAGRDQQPSFRITLSLTLSLGNSAKTEHRLCIAMASRNSKAMRMLLSANIIRMQPMEASRNEHRLALPLQRTMAFPLHGTCHVCAVSELDGGLPNVADGPSKSDL
jgi:phage terminase large subunit-like protein